MNRKKIKPTSRGFVLAEGEVTGHCHAVKNINSVEMYEDGNVKFLEFLDKKQGVQIEHEEHESISLNQEGIDGYGVGIVEEFDHVSQLARRVAD